MSALNKPLSKSLEQYRVIYRGIYCLVADMIAIDSVFLRLDLITACMIEFVKIA